MATTVSRCATHGQCDAVLNVLEDQSSGAISYEVVYGLHRQTFEDATAAFKEYTDCVHHALSCASFFDDKE